MNKLNTFLFSFRTSILLPLGLLAYAASQWLLFVYFVYLGGMVSGGNFALAQAFAAPVFAFASLTLRQLWVSRPSERGNYGHIVLLRCFTTLLALIFIPAITFLTGANLELEPFAFVLFIKSMEQISDIFYARLDSQDKSNVVGILLLAKGFFVSSSIAICTLYKIKPDILGIMFIFIYLVMIIIELLLAKPIFNENAVNDFKIFSLPYCYKDLLKISIANLVIAITGFLPRYAIDIFSTRDNVGIFSAAMMPFTVIMLIATGFSQSALNRLSHTVNDFNYQEFIEIVKNNIFVLLIIIIISSIILYVASIYTFLFYGQMNTSIIRYSSHFTLIMAPSILAQFLSYAYLPVGDYKSLIRINVAALLLSFMLSAFLVKLDPLYGAVILATIPSVVQIVAFSFFLRRHFSGHWNRGEP